MVVDAARHVVSLETVLVFLVHTLSVDQELESLFLGTVVEKEVPRDCGEWFLVLVSGLEILVGLSARRRQIAALPLCYAGAVLLVALLVSFLAISVAVRGRFAAAAQPRRVACGAGRTNRHLDVVGGSISTRSDLKPAVLTLESVRLLTV